MRKTGASQQELLRSILRAELPEGENRDMLEAMGVETTYAALILAAVVRRASEKADMDSLRYIRDTLGEKPAGASKPERPVRGLELEKLSDAELEALADRQED